MEGLQDLLVNIGDSLSKNEVEEIAFLLKDHRRGKLPRARCIQKINLVIYLEIKRPIDGKLQINFHISFVLFYIMSLRDRGDMFIFRCVK